MFLNPGAIERAVKSFIEDSHIQEGKVDELGMFNQTIESIASATIFSPNNDSRQFWIITGDNQEVLAYYLAHVSKDIDNKLCYWITQAWAHPSIRGTKMIKEGWGQIRDEAKRLLCKHIVIPSSRNPKAYCRFLGKGWHQYATLLKEDI